MPLSEKPFKLERIHDRVWLANFDNRYDLAMTFCRYQEYYESPNEKFRGQQFEMFDFMDWYSRAYGQGSFTYPKDWAGFNLPGRVVFECFKGVTDRNRYDCSMMNDIYLQCCKDVDFYLIGAVGYDEITIKHELAHGLYYTNPAYKFEMSQLVDAMKPKDRDFVYDYFGTIGYTEQVYKDEIQAYMSTGMLQNLIKKRKKLSSYAPAFEAIFNKHVPAKDSK